VHAAPVSDRAGDQDKETGMPEERIGFIGVGKMGGPMSRRLLDAGYEVIAYDTDAAMLGAAVRAGARAAAGPKAVADEADIVLASLPSPAVLEAVALGDNGVCRGSRVRIFIDISTTGPRIAARIAEGLAQHDIATVDSPVSGGLAGARDGKLAVMVSCPRPVFAEVEPVLRVFGKLFFLGETPGAAQVMKLANNLLSAAALAVSSEAVVMGVKAGLDAKIMLDVINAGSGRNSATQDKFPKAVLPRTFDFGFATGLLFKDVRLCLDEAEALGVPMVVGSAVRQMLCVTNALYGPESDFTSMVKTVETWAQVEVRSATYDAEQPVPAGGAR
jgi:3-hydroxyisobutyrate dehydrogenase-like beta-hydroxyacid dehydrogenase